MSRKSFKPGALTAPLPPVMVTVGDMEEYNVLTIGWTGILATHPPRTYISVRPERYSFELLEKTGEFVINLAKASQARIVDYVGIYTGKKVDKFRECSLTPVKSEKVNTPTILECPLSLECRVCDVIPMGTHHVFVADIVSVSCDEEILDSEGRICFDRADLLAYAHGEYFALGEKVGKFGFSTNREEKNVVNGGKKQTVKKTDVGKKATKDKSAKEEKKPFYYGIKGVKGKKRTGGGKRK